MTTADKAIEPHSGEASLGVQRARIPLVVKLSYTAFMAVLIPVYLWYYGPTNFLYFCDQALLLTLVGVWLEKPLLISLPAVGIVAPQLLWIADFFGTMFGVPLVGMTQYMFNENTSLFLRALSGFHGWLPLLLIYLVIRLGYDRRALLGWTVMSAVTVLMCFFFMPPPMPNAGLTPVNINYVWGPQDAVAQTWMHPYAWLGVMIIGLPVALYLPTHFFLRWLAPEAKAGR